MIKIYNFIIFLLTPILALYFLRRKKNGKENLEKFPQKLGIYNIERPKEKLLWFHAVSVGETLSVIPLMNELCTTYNIKILLTTSTVTSEKIIQGRLHKNIIHQFAPLDKKQYVISFLNHFQPDLGAWVEAELWPNLIIEASKRNFPMILLNARISDKAPLRNYFYKSFIRDLINQFDLILPQEKRDFHRIESFTTSKVTYIGNLKLNCPPLPFNESELNSLKKLTKNRKLFLAASTHPGEEDFIADVHRELRNHHPNLLTIIVPRHPERSSEIEYFLQEAKMLSITLRSSNEKITDKTDIYIADTLGELGLFYRLCNISFIGGSLVSVGGHNPIEAIKCNSAVISGNFIKNFSDLYYDLRENNSAIVVSNIFDLEKQINEFLLDQNALDKHINAAAKYIANKPNIVKNTIKEFEKLLPLKKL